MNMTMESPCFAPVFRDADLRGKRRTLPRKTSSQPSRGYLEACWVMFKEDMAKDLEDNDGLKVS
jgi:hypothetical protein